MVGGFELLVALLRLTMILSYCFLSEMLHAHSFPLSSQSQYPFQQLFVLFYCEERMSATSSLSLPCLRHFVFLNRCFSCGNYSFIPTERLFIDDVHRSCNSMRLLHSLCNLLFHL